MKNPYLVALATVTSVLGGVALILYIVAMTSAGEVDPESQLAIIVAANTWSAFACYSLLATLILGGVMWKSTAPTAEGIAGAAESIRQADARVGNQHTMNEGPTGAPAKELPDQP